LDEKDRQYHEVANIFPLMSAEEYEALKVDIATNGLLEPVWLHPDDHSIIDGRNRHKACVELGKDPKFRYWDKQGSLVSFVVSLNLKRRHLNAMQKAARRGRYFAHTGSGSEAATRATSSTWQDALDNIQNILMNVVQST
jgi:hypothetical protein